MALVGFGIVLGGCAKHRSVSALSAEARASELRAFADYRGEKLRVTVVVTSTGLKKVTNEAGVATGAAISPGLGLTFGAAEWQTSKRMTGFPYLTGRDPQHGEEAGQLLCFFYPEDIRDVAGLTLGTEVQLVGVIQEFTERGHKVVMNSCELE
jgi:alpha-D-ribose 1-methylphosphonate 5-triphosphate synthase subunit PhnG